MDVRENRSSEIVVHEASRGPDRMSSSLSLICSTSALGSKIVDMCFSVPFLPSRNVGKVVMPMARPSAKARLANAGSCRFGSRTPGPRSPQTAWTRRA